MLLPTSIHNTLNGLSEFQRSIKLTQVQIDFATGFFTNNMKQLGTVFCNDYAHQGFPILFIICNAEDKSTCTMALEYRKNRIANVHAILQHARFDDARKDPDMFCGIFIFTSVYKYNPY